MQKIKFKSKQKDPYYYEEIPLPTVLTQAIGNGEVPLETASNELVRAYKTFDKDLTAA